MDEKLQEYIRIRLEWINQDLENCSDPEKKAYLNGKKQVLVNLLSFLDQHSPEEGSMEPRLQELVDAQQKHIDRQTALIEMQDRFIQSLMEGGK